MKRSLILLTIILTVLAGCGQKKKQNQKQASNQLIVRCQLLQTLKKKQL